MSNRRIANIINQFNKLKINKNKNKFKPLPETFEEFCQLIQIVSGSQLLNFNLYDYQKELIKIVEQYPTTVVGKVRQVGISELFCAYCLYRAAKDKTFTALVISRTGIDSSALALRTKKMYLSLTEYFEFESDSLLHLRIANGGQIVFRNANIDAARGIPSCTVIWLDEVQSIPDVQLILTAAIPTQSMVEEDKAKIILTGTPKGTQNFLFARLIENNDENVDVLDITKKIRNDELPPFYYLTDSINKTAKVFIHWKTHPIYSLKENYLENLQLSKGLTREQILQEYDLSFTDVSTGIFSIDLIEKCRKDYSFNKEPVGDYLRYAGLDCSSTNGKDYLVLTIFKDVYDPEIDDGVLTLEYVFRTNKGSTESNLLRVKDILKMFQVEAVGIEVNGIGQVFYEQISRDLSQFQVLSIKTTSQSKSPMVNRLKYLMENSQFVYPLNYNLLTNELLSFKEKDDGSMAAESGHDDILMSVVFSCYTWWETNQKFNKKG